MPHNAALALSPRKSPVQARSSASVQALLEATIQVLLAEGKQHLTTTRVAHRAGVSVGTLYQYFPNKSALLQAVLRHHMDDIALAIERVRDEHRGATLRRIGEALVTAYLAAKMKDPHASAALYSVSSDIDGQRIAQATAIRTHKAIAVLLQHAGEPISIDPHLAASMVQSAMVGVSRQLLECDSPRRHLPILKAELTFFVCAYLEARIANTDQPRSLISTRNSAAAAALRRAR